ncbi:MAG: amino acid ABC transporter substrate-binding protein [Desulfohalobiaceae bacterium]|nr:amino acid ABC transporter substrate-binding protein [Desulfohalobiaceae bacterium]
MKKICFLGSMLLSWCIFCGLLPAAAADNPPIRIGATVSLEGPYAEPSMMIRDAFRLWEQEVNQNGGLLGRKVKLILYNDKSQRRLVNTYYHKLIEKDRVDLVFSPYGTPLTLTASNVSEEHNLFMLACAASGERIWERGFEYVVGMYALAERFFIGLLDLMARNGHTTVSLVYSEESSFNLDVAEGARKWAEKFDIAVVRDKGYRNGETVLPEIVSEFKAAEARRVLVSAYPPDCYRLLEEMRKKNYKPEVLGMTIAPIHPDFLEKAGRMGKRVFAPSQWEANERIPFPGTRKFIKSFRSFTGKLPTYHAGSAYAACQLYEEAIRQTQSLDNRKIRDYIVSLDTVTVIGRFKVDATGRQVGHNPLLIQWQAGRKEIVWPPRMQTAEPQL